ISPGMRRVRSPERRIGALAILCLVLMALLAGQPYFTNASRPPRGISDPGIALEVVRSLDEVDYILGDAPSPDREVMRIKEYVGVMLLASRTTLFAALALALISRGGLARIAAPAALICAAASAAFAVLSKIAILRILDVPLIRTTPGMINAIRSSSAA